MNSGGALRLAAILVLLVSGMAAADEPKVNSMDAVPLRLDDAIKQALSRRLDVRMEETQLRITQAKIDEARGVFLPTLDLLSDAQHIKSYDNFSGVEASATILGQPVTVSVTSNVPEYQSSAALEANWNVFAGGFNSARLEGMQAHHRIAQAQRDVTRQNVILDVSGAYWLLRKAQIQHAHARRAAALAAEEARFAITQFEQGRLSKIDKQIKLLQAAETEMQAKQTQRSLEERIQAYLSALGPRAGASALAVGDLQDEPDGIDIAALLKQGGMPRPALAKTQAEVMAAQARAREESSAFYPRLDLFGRYAEIGRDEDSLNDALSDIHRQSRIVGVRLRWNLFNGLQSTHRLNGARQESTLAEMRMEQKQRELSDNVRIKTRRLEALQDDLELAEKRLALSEAQERVAKVRLEMDQISKLQYQSSILALQEASDKVMLIKADLLLARIDLALASGDK